RRPALMAQDLGDEVRGGAEAVEADALRVAGETQRPVADQPGAEERGCLGVAERGRQREHEARIGHGVLGVAPVALVAGEAGIGTEILRPAAAEAAATAGPAEPGHSDAIADVHPRDAGPGLLDGPPDLVP